MGMKNVTSVVRFFLCSRVIYVILIKGASETSDSITSNFFVFYGTSDFFEWVTVLSASSYDDEFLLTLVISYVLSSMPF